MKCHLLLFLLLSLSLPLLVGCNQSAPASSAVPSSSGPSLVFLSVVSDVNEHPQSIDMAMKIAGFALEENRKVFMFFNVKAVHIPTGDLADDFAFGDNEPIKKQLADLIDRGVEVHVCPVCMKALGVEKGDLMEGAEVTTRPGLFANIGSNTTVFTY